jgi:DNA adenine methylase
MKRGLRIPLGTLRMENDRDLYGAHRERLNDLIDRGRAGTREAAALFYYLNRTGYNGLCRFNRSGRFNVPFGRYRTIRYRTDFSPYRKLFARWEFTCGNFEALSVSAADFIYADPPYDVEFTQYSRQGFGWDDQVRLAEWLRAHPGPVVLSNQATDRIVALYKKMGFRLRYLRAPRMISCNGDRTPAREVLATRGV